MRKIKSTALLGAFVAVASVGVISHEAHGTTIGTPNNVPGIIAKETLPASSASLQASIIPSVGFNGTSSSSIVLKISGASFLAGASYTISGAGISCTDVTSSVTNTLTFTSCTVSASTAYPIVSGGSDSTFSVTVPQGTSSIVLSYSSNVSGDTAGSATIAEAQQQLTVTPANAATAFIDPSSLSTFSSGQSDASGSSAWNSVVSSNNAYGNTTWSNTINASDTMIFLFTSIPSSVSLVSASDSAKNAAPTSQTPGNASATISFTLAQANPPFGGSLSSDTMTFTFSNSSNVSISTGTISLSSITGVAPNASASNYVYLSTPQNFLTFAVGGTQIYVPDALAPDGNNGILAGYITISMPSTASIASISVLNTGVICPAPTLAPTGTTSVSYIDLSQLPSLCSSSITPKAWGSGVPLVINISGTNATPSNITADAYAVFGGMLKRIPVNVLNASSSSANFSY